MRPSWCLLLPAFPEEKPSSSWAGRGCQGGAQLGGWQGLRAALPCPSTLRPPHWRRPFCSRPPAPRSCSFESPAWEAVDASPRSLFRPLSSPWRQPCSSLGCLINSIINAQRRESPRSFLTATHALQFKRPADRKQGPVPGDAPAPPPGPFACQCPAGPLGPVFLGSRGGPVREESERRGLAGNLAGGARGPLGHPALSNGCKVSLAGEALEPRAQDGLRRQQPCPPCLRAEEEQKATDSMAQSCVTSDSPPLSLRSISSVSGVFTARTAWLGG